MTKTSQIQKNAILKKIITKKLNPVVNITHLKVGKFKLLLDIFFKYFVQNKNKSVVRIEQQTIKAITIGKLIDAASPFIIVLVV